LSNYLKKTAVDYPCYKMAIVIKGIQLYLSACQVSHVSTCEPLIKDLLVREAFQSINVLRKHFHNHLNLFFEIIAKLRLLEIKINIGKQMFIFDGS